MKKLCVVFAVMFMFVVFFAAQAVAETYESDNNGNWDTLATWDPEGKPGGEEDQADTAAIVDGHTVTVNSTVPSASGATVTTVTITDGTLMVVENGSLASAITIATNGVLQIGDGGAAGIVTGAITAGGGELIFDHTGPVDFTNAISGGNLSLVRKGVSSSTTTLSTGAKNFGSGTISVNSGTLSIAQEITSTGAKSVTGGTLEFVEGGLGGSGAVTVDGGTLKWAATNTTDGISSRLSVVSGTLDIASAGVTFAAVPAVTGTLTKAGVGDLTLNGTIPGNWTVNAGTLILSENSNFSEADKTLLINPGAALEIVGDKMLTIGANAKLEIKKGGELVVGSDGAINLSALGSTVTLLSTSLDDFGGDAFDPDNPGRVFVNGGNDKGLKMTKALYDEINTRDPELLGFLVEDPEGIEIIDEPSPGRSSSGGCAATGFAPFAVLALLGMAALRRRA